MGMLQLLRSLRLSRAHDAISRAVQLRPCCNMARRALLLLHKGLAALEALPIVANKVKGFGGCEGWLTCMWHRRRDMTQRLIELKVRGTVDVVQVKVGSRSSDILLPVGFGVSLLMKAVTMLAGHTDDGALVWLLEELMLLRALLVLVRYLAGNGMCPFIEMRTRVIKVELARPDQIRGRLLVAVVVAYSAPR